MTATPFVRAPVGTSNAMVWGPPAQVWAAVSAARSDPAPESAVLVTVNVVAATEAAPRPRARPSVRVRFKVGLLLKIECFDDEHGHLAARGVVEGAVSARAAASGDAFRVELLDPVGEEG